MTMSDAIIHMMIRFAGALSGSIMALAGEPPESRKDLYRRVAVSIPAGVIFGDYVRETAHMADTLLNMCGGAAIASAASWFILSMGIRISKIWKPK